MTDRILYSDDCLRVLNDHSALPTGSVDLIYLDPPFNSKSTYNLPFPEINKDNRAVEAFTDTWTWSNKEDALLRDLSTGPATSTLADIVTLAQKLTPKTRGGAESCRLPREHGGAPATHAARTCQARLDLPSL